VRFGDIPVDQQNCAVVHASILPGFSSTATLNARGPGRACGRS
jgi:hypothetical protein